MNKKALFLETLKAIKEFGPKRQHAGICANSDLYRTDKENLGWYECYKFVRDYSSDWSSYSGVAGYPIPSTLAGMCPEECFNEHVLEYNLWDKETEYGRLRWELLDYLIERVEEDLKG